MPQMLLKFKEFPTIQFHLKSKHISKNFLF